MSGTRALLLILVVLALLIVIFLIWFVGTYNRLVGARNQADAAGAQVDVQLKRRHDLIPNLVETVKGYAGHERGTLESVVAARQAALASAGSSRAEQAGAEAALGASLSRLFALAEAYPDLKANQNFLALQAEAATTEDKIAYARQFLNGAVQTFNTAVQSFPSSAVAAMTGMRAREYFRTSDDERGPVAIRF